MSLLQKIPTEPGLALDLGGGRDVIREAVKRRHIRHLGTIFTSPS
jgi:DNA-binding FadR family transcriptional regulator